ncbi:hypothetical protein GOV09_06170 [Candidatus Woesearchaeota archaeon]|nr:hypothetical protein [Candidatus Woesearchaeota archaeon]
MKKTIILLLLALFVIYGCDDGSTVATTDEDPFIGGTDGLIISFEEDAPPDEVFDGGDFPFDIAVRLENEGEAAINKEDIRVTISGVLASEFSKTELGLVQNPEEDVRANRKDSEGDIDESSPVFVEYRDFNHVGMLTGNTKFTFRADVCYLYETTANSKICIKGDNLDDDDDDVCTINENKDVFSSGAPLQIEDFKENSRAKNKISFTFDVVHKGNGRIYLMESSCDESSRKFEDRIYIEVDSGIEGLECSGLSEGDATSGFITLYGNEKPVTCTQTVATNSDYEQPVVVKLVYDYEGFKEKSVLVKHSLT